MSSNSAEVAYLETLKELISSGTHKKNRTINKTYSSFGKMFTYMLSSMSERHDTTSERHDMIIPLLTTKRVPFRLVVEELLWFISGSTDAKKLQAKDIHIWDANATREFLDGRGLHDLPEGDIGAGYGFQWRHFGADYKNCHTDYGVAGTDQLIGVIKSIKTDPFGRRHIVSAWNPAQLDEMALPPCHISFQFNVDPDEDDISQPKYLDCCMYQRSADFPLGVPFNIASYSILTHMVAQQTGLVARKFIHMIGDCHIYENQVEGCLEQVKRTPGIFPKLLITPASDITSYTFANFKLVDYKPQPEIKYPLSV